MNTTGPEERISDVEHRNEPQLNNMRKCLKSSLIVIQLEWRVNMELDKYKNVSFIKSCLTQQA